MAKPIVVWFRHDLRLTDHVSLLTAVKSGAPIVPLFVLDDDAAGQWSLGGASRWWLHHSLSNLHQSLVNRGASLLLRRGRTEDVIAGVVREIGAESVHCSRNYEPWAQALERKVRDAAETVGAVLKRFPGALLHEPDRLKTQAGGPFKVYTPFWRALSGSLDVGMAQPAPSRITGVRGLKGEDLASWGLLPTRPDWACGLREAWKVGEEHALARLDAFLERAISAYGADRNRPDLSGTSRLSPYLHFGEISPRQAWSRAIAQCAARPTYQEGLQTFLKELAWREFSYHLLFHFPHLPEAPFKPEFQRFPWRRDDASLKSWQKGLTGFPIVDAGMRELWTTGWMHNRVRMIVASFLIKDLMIPWQMGEAWFWDTLVDADLASNAASWQWVAGSGADAAPFFRIFNPVSQGQKFDPDGAYVRRWVPELAQLPSAVIHEPWAADDRVLKASGVVLGKSYPLPIVDHALQRKAALAAFMDLKAG